MLGTVQTSRRPRAYYAFIRWSQLRPLRPRTAARPPRPIIIVPIHAHSLCISLVRTRSRRSLSHRFPSCTTTHSLTLSRYLATLLRTPSTTPIDRPRRRPIAPPPHHPSRADSARLPLVVRSIMISTTIVSGRSSGSSQNENGFDDRLTTRSYLRSGWLNTNDLFIPGALST